jgi:transposase InsO family protein
MPFQETHVMDERRRFVEEVYRSLRSFSELCRRFGISRKTGYKWLERWERGGAPGLEDRSRRPRSCPWATPPEVIEAIVEVRKRFPDYGAKKIRWYLEEHRADLALPSRTTIHNLLHRRGFVQPRRRRVRRWHPGRPGTVASEPNAIWTVDYKGQFRLGNGVLCYPLTAQDRYSRYLLACRGLRSTEIQPARVTFERAFRQFGLPQRIRSDNGTPFASNALGRLSGLSVWFIRLGIMPELIEPASPQQNGTHENMHLHLKRRTAKKPRANLRAQQRAFQDFVTEYNTVRPHEALSGRVPAALYRPSPRPFPKRLPPITYPEHFEVRRVSKNGGVRWCSAWVNVSHLLAELPVGFEQVDQGLFDVYFGPVWLGRFLEAKRCIMDSRGRTQRRTGDNPKSPTGNPCLLT